MAKKNAYEELQRRQQEAFNNFPCFFAFNNRQFDEGLRKLGVTGPEEVYRGTAGMFYRKTDAGKLHELLNRLDSEKREAFKNDDFLYDAFYYELANHEFCITYDEEDALDALGITREELNQDPRMMKIFLKARGDYMSEAVC